MTMKHTPGPWLVGQYEPTAEFLAIRNHACVCLPDMGLVALTGRAEDRQSQVDADLIASAPDLLAVAQQAQRLLKAEAELRDSTDLSPKKRSEGKMQLANAKAQLLHNLTAAIAKAQGESPCA